MWCGGGGAGVVVVWSGVMWCVGVVLCVVVCCGVEWCGVVWCGVVWYGVVWCGVVWCGVFMPVQRFGAHCPLTVCAGRRRRVVGFSTAPSSALAPCPELRRVWGRRVSTRHLVW